MVEPIDFLIQYKDAVISAYHKAGKSPKGAWSALCEEFSELSQVMKYNTFKQYITAFVQITEKLSAVSPAPDKRLKGHNIDGWTLCFSKGYYRLHKKIKGRGHSIYIGKELDEAAARKKIKARVAEMEKGEGVK